MAHQFFFNPYILDNLPAPVKGFDVVQDVSEPRLRMYVTSRGIKTFFVRKRVHGKDKRILIGNYPQVDIEDARSAVPGLLDTAMKKPPIRRKKITFKHFLDIYLENKVRRGEDSHAKLVRAVNRHLVDLFDLNGQGDAVLTLEGTDMEKFREYLILVYDELLGKQYAGDAFFKN